MERALRGGVSEDDIFRFVSRASNAPNEPRLREELAELRHANEVAPEATGEVLVSVSGKVELNGETVDLYPVSEADVLYRDSAGVIHLNEVKRTPKALDDKLRGHPAQFENMVQWLRPFACEKAVETGVGVLESACRYFSNRQQPIVSGLPEVVAEDLRNLVSMSGLSRFKTAADLTVERLLPLAQYAFGRTQFSDRQFSSFVDAFIWHLAQSVLGSISRFLSRRISPEIASLETQLQGLAIAERYWNTNPRVTNRVLAVSAKSLCGELAIPFFKRVLKIGGYDRDMEVYLEWAHREIDPVVRADWERRQPQIKRVPSRSVRNPTFEVDGRPIEWRLFEKKKGVTLEPLERASLLFFDFDETWTTIHEIKPNAEALLELLTSTDHLSKMVAWRQVDLVDRMVAYVLESDEGWTRLLDSVFAMLADKGVTLIIGGQWLGTKALAELAAVVDEGHTQFLSSHPGSTATEFFTQPQFASPRAALEHYQIANPPEDAPR